MERLRLEQIEVAAPPTVRDSAGLHLARILITAVNMRTFSLSLALLSLAALAEDKRVSVPVGYSTTLEMPDNVKKVTLSDRSIVDVRQKGRKLTFYGTKQGSSSAIIHTGEGRHRVQTRVAVYVASDKYALPY